MRPVLVPSIPEHAPEIATILQQANAYKQAHGDTIWGNYQFDYDEIMELIQGGEMFTAVSDEEVVGCVRIAESNERIWDDTGEDSTALYIHRLATPDRLRGQGLGEAIIDLVAERARAADRDFLRLDCPTENEGLCNYYLSRGFSLVRSIEVAGKQKGVYKASLFERRA